MAIIVSPNWRDYARRYLADCMRSLRAQNWSGEHRIFLVDNESTEESLAYLRAEAPEAEIIPLPENAGYAGGNNAAMSRALAQGFDYLLLVNMDVVADPGCCSRLLEIMEGDVSIGAAQARIMFWPETDTVNSLGNITHFLGFGYSRGYRESISRFKLGPPEDICFPSGAAVLLRAQILRTVGLLDPEFWMYNEDQDLGWRIWLSGYRCVHVPDAIIYHKHEFLRNVEKFYWLDRNRLLSLLKNYHWLTILIILPALLVMECGLFYFAARAGWLPQKLRVYRYLFSPHTWRYLRQARRRVRGFRTCRDRDVVRMFSGRIWYPEIGGSALRAANPLFNAYWQTVKRFIFW